MSRDSVAGATSPLDDLARQTWDTVAAASPVMATLLGDRRFDAALDELSEAAEAALGARLRDLRATAERIDPDLLDAEGLVTRGTVIATADYILAFHDAGAAELACEPMAGPHLRVLRDLPRVPIRTADQAEAHLRRLAAVPRMLEEALDRLRAGVAKQRTPTARNVQRVLHQLDGYLGGPLDADPLLRVATPAQWGGADAWQEQLVAAVRDTVRAAVRAYRDALAAEVAPHARPDDRPGLCWLDGGAGAYERLIVAYTTLPVSAEELHAAGRAELKGPLAEELSDLAGPALGTADWDEVIARLRDDPALAFDSADAMMEVAGRCLTRAADAMERWFGRLPQAPCEIEPVPDYLAADAPAAYYTPPASDGSRPGTYWLNVHEPATRKRYEAESIAFHEAIPGHHLQRAIAGELDHLPELRRHAPAVAYAEGWGLYAERLADEMDLHSGDLDRVGMVTADAWRAARLVVDTGLHAMGWSRQQAIDYLRGVSPQSLDDITVEVDRYIGLPGQALAYKVGQQTLLRLREEARAALGDRFDIAGFHDTVLGSGPVTLDLLGDLVERFVAERQASQAG